MWRDLPASLYDGDAVIVGEKLCPGLGSNQLRRFPKSSLIEAE